MDTKDVIKFLICSLIPEVSDKKMLPENVGKDDWIWKCVNRAHRDVLAGRSNVVSYSCKKEQSVVGKQYNVIAFDLYNEIKNSKDTINTRDLINKLYMKYKNEHEEIIVGAIQKLINMTFKYLVTLKWFGIVDYEFIDIEKCDCPLDSIILKTTDKFKEEKWTKIKDYNRYEYIQNDQQINGLKYDFEHYYDYIGDIKIDI